MKPRSLVLSLLLVGSFAYADKPKAKKPAKHDSIVGRVVGLEIYTDDGHDTAVVTILAGSEQGVQKGWHASSKIRIT